jgi:hypothetical protein
MKKSQGQVVEVNVNSKEKTLRTFVWISFKNPASGQNKKTKSQNNAPITLSISQLAEAKDVQSKWDIYEIFSWQTALKLNSYIKFVR